MCSILHILHKGRESTFRGSRRWEMTDIILCTQGMINLVRDWRISSKPEGSDLNLRLHFIHSWKIQTPSIDSWIYNMSSCFTQYCHIQVTITTDNRTQQQYNKYNQIQTQREWGHNPRLTNWMGYRANRGCQLKQAPTNLILTEDLEVASQFISNVIKDFYEIAFPLSCRTPQLVFQGGTQNHPSSRLR
jgi:hypothetical protein